MKRSVNMKLTARLQLLSFTLGDCSYIPDAESRQEMSRLKMVTVIYAAQIKTDGTISPGSESRLSGRNVRTNS